jgi:hypothetical protein
MLNSSSSANLAPRDAHRKPSEGSRLSVSGQETQNFGFFLKPYQGFRLPFCKMQAPPCEHLITVPLIDTSGARA